MKPVFLFALLALVVLPACVEAKKYQVLGAGTNSCAAWTKTRTEAPDSVAEIGAVHWVLGFISSYNLYGPGSGNLTMG